MYENFGMVHFAEINQALSSDSILRDIGRVAILKLVPRHLRLRYLQTTLIMGGRDRIYMPSQNLCEVLSKNINEK